MFVVYVILLMKRAAENEIKIALHMCVNSKLKKNVQPFTIAHIVIGLSLHIHSFPHLRHNLSNKVLSKTIRRELIKTNVDMRF